MNHLQRFPIGTVYTPAGRKYRATVTDFHVTTNRAGQVVKVRYVSTHEFCGMRLEDVDVLETTIARGNPEIPA